MNRQLETPKRPFVIPMATVALVLAIAMASAAVWVVYATPDAGVQADPPWWPGLGAVPTR